VAMKPSRSLAVSSNGREARPPRLAAQVARELEDRILAAKWPIGYQIGREADLAAGMGVSRWTLREAVRILESYGFVEARKGAKGGLFVASSPHDFACKMLSNYFEFVQVSGQEFAEIDMAFGHMALERTIATLTPGQAAAWQARLDAASNLPLAKELEALGSVQQALIAASGNPIIVLFQGALNRMTFDACIYSELDDDAWHGSFRAMIAIIRAMALGVIESDIAKARAASDDFTAICRRFIETSAFYQRKPVAMTTPQRAYDFFPPARPTKKADHVERAIREMIFEEERPAGTSLGSEKELAARFRVGRWVLREALRSLEQLGVIEVGRGGRSGLLVVSPDPAVLAEACRRQLGRERARPAHAAPVRAKLDELTAKLDGPLPAIALFQRVLAKM